MIKIRRGLDIPLAGAPEQTIAREFSPRHVALVGADYVGMKPTMAVAEGDTVAKGQAIFTDKKCEGVVYTAPASGRVTAINRGARRVFQSLVIEVADGVEARNWGGSSAADAAALSADDIKDRLIDSGEWTAIRVRPFNKVADPATSPSGLFITAIDTRPHAVNPEIVIAEQREAFELGQALLANMVDCTVYVCVAPGSNAPVASHAQVQSAAFDGPHPAGLAGTHVHF
ncbi:MAG: NADH:ubiquinone reductase (Na(+)-transporting) subunit A, partial [Pseudomonadota bacterium]|nr:NADH:ubiquinone reductase (Na(+)-transporting) subunit A [Pseudomonadota bacterium]